MIQKYQKFLEDREYLHNCTAKTMRYYRQTWDVWGKYLPEDPTEITEDTIRGIIIALKKNTRLKPVSVKTNLRALNVFLGWLKVVPRVPLKSIIVPTVGLKLFSPEQVSLLLRAEHQSVRERRIILVIAIVAGTGLRAEEVLHLRCADVDLLASSLHVEQGKGQKSRDVPLSQGLRKRLVKYLEGQDPTSYLFPTRSGSPLSYRNALRDLKLFAARHSVQGPRISFHTIRHSFGTHYIRQGGSIEMLSRILGHTTLTMTQRYVHLQTEDLRRVHDRYSMV